jgi:exopolysaccharide biosynthesis polyprenyl glycosylphosphotransferase
MYNQQVNYLISFLMLLDAVIVIAAGYFAAGMNWGEFQHDWEVGGYEFLLLVLFLMFTANFTLGKLGLYSAKRSPSLGSTLYRITLGVASCFFVLSVGHYLLGKEPLSHRFVACYAISIFLMMAFVRIVLELYLEKRLATSFNTRTILIAGSSERAGMVHDALKEQKSWGHRVVGFLRDYPDAPVKIEGLPELGPISSLKDVLVEHQVDEVVFALSSECERGGLKDHILLCEVMGINYRILPNMFDPEDARRIRVEEIQGVPTLTKDTVGISPSGLLYKKLLDIGVGLVGMAVLALIFPPIALAIKLDSPGPVLFRQVRVGRHGRLFHVYKFRTMVQDAEANKEQLMDGNEMNGLMFKIKDDPRVTRVGRFLRRTSLDEMPQFINVIRGEMSVVGTRPPTIDEVSRYESRHRRRISMRPGITGLWQVSGRNKITDFEEVVRLDLQYIDTWRFTNDLKIIFRTVAVVLQRKGAC